jgi:hypothetical protein
MGGSPARHGTIGTGFSLGEDIADDVDSGLTIKINQGDHVHVAKIHVLPFVVDIFHINS